MPSVSPEKRPISRSAKPSPRGAAVEGELSVVLLVVDGIELVFAHIDAEAELVAAADHGDVVGKLVGVDVENARSAGAAADVKAAARVVADAELRVVRNRDIHVDAQIFGAEQIRCIAAVIASAVEGDMEGVDQGRREGVCIAYGHGLRTLVISCGSGSQGVSAVEQGLANEIVDVVTGEYRLLAAEVIVDAADVLIVGVVGEVTVIVLTAGVG